MNTHSRESLPPNQWIDSIAVKIIEQNGSYFFIHSDHVPPQRRAEGCGVIRLVAGGASWVAKFHKAFGACISEAFVESVLVTDNM